MVRYFLHSKLQLRFVVSLFTLASCVAYSQVNNRDEEWTPASSDVPEYNRANPATITPTTTQSAPTQIRSAKPAYPLPKVGDTVGGDSAVSYPSVEQSPQSNKSTGGRFWNFPEWKPAKFGLHVRPVGGQSFYKDPLNSDDIRISEVGLTMKVLNVPLIPGNPGFTFSPAGTYAYGLFNRSGEGTDDFSRYWLGGSAHLYFHSLRFKFGGYVGKWRQRSDGKTDYERNLHSYQAGVALKVNAKHFIGWDADYRRQFEQKFDLPTLTEIDQWLYWDARLKMLSAHFRVGPGVKSSRIFAPPGEELDKGNAFLVRASSSFRLFKMLSASLGAVYIIGDNYENEIIADEPYRTPFQSRNSAFYDIALGEGALDIHTRVNLTKLAPGIGLYFLYNHRIFNAFDSDERRHERGFSIGGGYTLPIQTRL